MNGFIFFAQVVVPMSFKANSSLPVVKPLKVLIHTYQAIYGFFSMEFFSSDLFGHSFCLWTGTSTLDVLVTKYATIVYAFVLVMALVLIMDYCNCNCYQVYKCLRNRNISTSFVQGLSAFLIMCYSQCVRVTFEILRYISCQSLNHTIKAVLVKGSFTYFGIMYLPYAIPALFFLFILIISTSTFPILCTPFHAVCCQVLGKSWDKKTALFSYHEVSH